MPKSSLFSRRGKQPLTGLSSFEQRVLTEQEAESDAKQNRRFESKRSLMMKRSFQNSCLLDFPFLAGRNEMFLESLMSEVDLKLYSPGDVIMTEGALEETTFFLVFGTVEVLKGPDQKKIVDMAAPTLFGEQPLILGAATRRTATIRAVSICDCRTIHQRIFNQILRTFPGEKSFYRNMACERAITTEQRPIAKAKRTPLLECLLETPTRAFWAQAPTMPPTEPTARSLRAASKAAEVEEEQRRASGQSSSPAVEEVKTATKERQCPAAAPRALPTLLQSLQNVRPDAKQFAAFDGMLPLSQDRVAQQPKDTLCETSFQKTLALRRIYGFIYPQSSARQTFRDPS
ncbi:unnamed protein product [Polarella glacialis]|uniref:Cyclic nucleotide-binding domain-containing protein n=1 Tax=Polarella glacialis TaxID=89957 RepID=A0A813G3K9_POLGL|nr:unnamed protein product [Polarella glacialis]